MALRMTSPCKPAKNGVYYFRKRVPADLVGIVGKTEVKFSLKTKDPAEAKQLCREADGKVSRQWNALRKEPEPLPLKIIMALAGQAYHQLVSQMDLEPGEPEIWQAALARIRRESESGNLDKWYGPTADGLLLEYGYRADAVSRKRLLEEIHRAISQGAGVNLRKAQGDYSPDPKAERFPDIDIAPPNNGKTVTFEELFAAWENSQENPRPKTMKDWKRILTNLKKFVEHNDAKRVSGEDIRKWIDYLILKKKLSRRTVKEKNIAAIKAIYRAAIDKRLLEIDAPTSGIIINVRKKPVLRSKGFTDEEAKRILLATFDKGTFGDRTGERLKLAYRWMPWLCSYTGARGGEIAQLRKEDVQEQDGIPFVRITPEAGTVKTDQYRDVPLHPYLVEQGFLDFVKDRPSGPLFYKSTTGAEGETRGPWENVRDKVGGWTKKVGKITGKSVQPTHAWRHRFKTLCRRHGIEIAYANAIQGHAEPGAAAGYGEFPLDALYREIKKLPRFPSRPDTAKKS